MQEISLQSLLEAGCHFGHKAERWNPKAASFIYTQKDGIHIIDLAKTKTGLEAALAYMKGIVAAGGEMLFVGTKRQAAGVVKEAVEKVGAPYLTHRWIGGFLTNWDAVHKNIEKINRLTEEQKTGAWKKFPKHERTKLAHYL
ncbi:30S ribosomal protein S2, partial [Candidatus Gottesmanbacteria bacterium RIFCSPHIGHO2_01_FULL_46_14]